MTSNNNVSNYTDAVKKNNRRGRPKPVIAVFKPTGQVFSFKSMGALAKHVCVHRSTVMRAIKGDKLLLGQWQLYSGDLNSDLDKCWLTPIQQDASSPTKQMDNVGNSLVVQY